MTYAVFLGVFILLPTLAAFIYLLFTGHRRVQPRGWLGLGIHVVLAVIYTTPWDNHLVRSGVWWYDSDRIWGITLGWVPLEEYLFFAFQTLLTGALVLILFQRAPRSIRAASIGWVGRLGAGMLMLVTAGLFAVLTVTGPEKWRYGSLILGWALVPLAVQFMFGIDILLSRWKLVIPAALGPTFYLSLADAFAIQSGIWTISPRFSSGVLLGGLPIEEALFFLVTNCLVVFGLSMVLDQEGRQRALRYLRVPGRQEFAAAQATGRKEPSL